MNRLISFFYWLSILIAVIAALYAFIVFTGLLFGCVAWGQDIYLPVLRITNNTPGGIYIVEPDGSGHWLDTNNPQPARWSIDSNGVTHSRIERRGPQSPVPPLPQPSIRTRIHAATNEQGDVVEMWLKKQPQPTPLIQDAPKTNAYWVACPNCSVRAIRTPLRSEDVQTTSTPDGDQKELRLWFLCCRGEPFKARAFEFQETPIATRVSVPVK